MPAALQPAPVDASVAFPEPFEEVVLGSLLRHLCTVPDPRKERGKVHDFHAMLCLTVVGLLCGHCGMSAVISFAMGQGARRRFSGTNAAKKWRAQEKMMTREEAAPWLKEIGLVWRGVARVPDLMTLIRVRRKVKAADLQKALEAWFAEVLEAAGARRRLVVSVDGKTMRGAEGTHVLSAFVHEVELAVWSCEVEGKKNELSAMRDHLDELIEAFPGLWLLRGDAIFADKTLCELLVRSGKEWFFAIKGNQPNLREKLEILFSPILCAGSPEHEDEPKKRGPMWNCASTTTWSLTPSTASPCPA